MRVKEPLKEPTSIPTPTMAARSSRTVMLRKYQSAAIRLIEAQLVKARVHLYVAVAARHLENQAIFVWGELHLPRTCYKKISLFGFL